MLPVTDISALQRWGEPHLALRLGLPVSDPPPWATTLDEATDEFVLAEARLQATAERPLHILVERPEQRIRSARVVSHVWSGPLPEGAFYQLTPSVLLASPSFVLQQMSARRSLAECAVIASEICGTYARDASVPDGFFGRPQLGTLDALREHFASEHGYGAKRAREALRFVVDGSRSPMETVVVLLFTLPQSVGGCGLPAPRLNVRINIPADLQEAIDKPYVVVDLCWYDQRVILEYDSYRWHTTPRAVDSDSTRNEGLRDLGWMVRSVTAGMLANDAMRRHLVSKVMARFGRELPGGAEFDRLQGELVRALLRA